MPVEAPVAGEVALAGVRTSTVDQTQVLEERTGSLSSKATMPVTMRENTSVTL